MMRTMRSLAAAVVLAQALLSCVPECGDDVSATAVSPDRRWTAVSYVRDCGATTAYATHVAVRQAGWSWRPWRPSEGIVYVERARPTIELVWRDASHLAVRISGEGGRTFRREPQWRSVMISYERQ
jgi:hypothetical protein